MDRHCYKNTGSLWRNILLENQLFQIFRISKEQQQENKQTNKQKNQSKTSKELNNQTV